MTNCDGRRRTLRLALLPLALALLLAGCALTGLTGTPPGGNASPDPYHYRQPFQAGA